MAIESCTKSSSVKPLDEYVDRVYRFALTLARDEDLARDLAQECLLRAHAHWPRLRDPQAALAWLFRTTKNLWVDDRRRKTRRRSEQLESTDDPAARQSAVETTAIHREQLQQVLDWMQQLPERQRIVLHLHTVEQLSIDEIAEVVQISRGAVKSSLSVARKTLRARCFTE